MRVPFPTRIPILYALTFGLVLGALQQLQGTTFTFTVYCVIFIYVAAVAFNLAGGFARAAGSYVFFYSFLGLIGGLAYKAYLGEPGQSNLRSPLLTIQVFTGGICAMLVAVFISKRFSRKKALLGDLLKDENLRNAAIGCFAVGLALDGFYMFGDHESGTVLRAIGQVNRFLPMSIILATLYTIKKSKGQSAVGGLVILTVMTTFAFGLFSFSKEGMFTPMLCWLAAAASLRVKVRPYQIAAGAVVVYVMFHFFAPYSQYGRTQVSEVQTAGERIHVVTSLLGNLGEVREQALLAEDSDPADGTNMRYYDDPHGFFDRLTMIGPDDALISYTQESQDFFGLKVLPLYFANWVPHFLWRDKPEFGAGNAFAHKIGGILGDSDMSTGISFTPSGEAYQLSGWLGVLLVAPLIWILLFTVFDSLVGDVTRSPWGLLVIAMFAHYAPEGMLSGAVYITWFGAVGVIFVAIASAYVMPLIGTLIAGAKKTQIITLGRPVATFGRAQKNIGNSGAPGRLAKR